MNNKIKWIVVLIILVVVIAGAAVLYNTLAADNAADNLAGGDQQQGQQELQAAPDFTVLDADGKAVSLSDFKGKPVVLNFWASFCPPCKAEMPAFEEAFAKYGDKVEFMMVNAIDNVQETAESGRAFIEASDFTFPVYYDVEGSASMAYGVVGIPVTYFIDKAGNLVVYGNSALSLENIEQGLQMIIE